MCPKYKPGDVLVGKQDLPGEVEHVWRVIRIEGKCYHIKPPFTRVCQIMNAKYVENVTRKITKAEEVLFGIAKKL